MSWPRLKRFRAWVASRKRFLYPENWLEPERREDKTPAFTRLKQRLRRRT